MPSQHKKCFNNAAKPWKRELRRPPLAREHAASPELERPLARPAPGGPRSAGSEQATPRSAGSGRLPLGRLRAGSSSLARLRADERALARRSRTSSACSAPSMRPAPLARRAGAAQRLTVENRRSKAITLTAERNMKAEFNCPVSEKGEFG